MPKASRVGKFRQAAKEAAAAAAAPAAASSPADGGLSRGQKKRLAKREQYLRKESLVMGSLQLKKQQEQAKRIDGLDAIKEALMSTTTTRTNDDDDKKQSQAHRPNLLKTQKSRSTLLQRESNQLQLVMQHPAFQQDPLATIREHLTNSLAPQAAQRQKEQVQHERDVREAQKTAPKKPKRKKHRARPTRSKA
uniref:Ribosome biogenesis protein SLX9 n=1 Tax=Amphora coffeiformis TaxID=265554 RepID=A0A7S3L8S8_9STRA|eukprot:scaffold3028_cov174-Amphora_coffeaeformis.AAC.28